MAVLNFLSRHTHQSAEEIAEGISPSVGKVARQSVYNALIVLTDAGLVQRIQLPGSPARYETRVGDNHHHIVCRRCGRTADVDCAVGQAPCLQPSDAHGFVVDQAEVTYWGICPTCQQTESSKENDSHA